MTKKIAEQSIWTVRINSQLLYKKAVDGRTILLGMTGEENQKVAEVMGKAIDDIAKILEKRTTQHEAIVEKEEVTKVGPDVGQVVLPEEEASKKPSGTSRPSPRPAVTRGPGGKFISKKAPKEERGESEGAGDVEKQPVKYEEEKIEDNRKKDAGWSSIFHKLKS